MHALIAFIQCLEYSKIIYTPSVIHKILYPQIQIDSFAASISKIAFQIRFMDLT